MARVPVQQTTWAGAYLPRRLFTEPQDKTFTEPRQGQARPGQARQEAESRQKTKRRVKTRSNASPFQLWTVCTSL